MDYLPIEQEIGHLCMTAQSLVSLNFLPSLERQLSDVYPRLSPPPIVFLLGGIPLFRLAICNNVCTIHATDLFS